MLLQNIDRNELQQMLLQLDQALNNHQQWYNNLIRTLVCRLPCDKHDILPEAHKECRFGQWYYSTNIPKNIANHPGFIAIGEAHQHMHHLASQILTNLNTNNIIATLEYDNFANSLERLRLEIYTLKNELEILLYNHDPLTMAINRVNMLPMLREQQEQTRRQLQACCIAMIDLDLFKQVNDQYGHAIGDKILVILVRYLLGHMRSFDKIFRYGGEEFLLCILQVNLSEAFEMINRICKEIAIMPIDVGLPTPLHITISAGVTILDPNASVEQSIEHADKALYMAKSSGRNQAQIWSPDMDRETS